MIGSLQTRKSPGFFDRGALRFAFLSAILNQPSCKSGKRQPRIDVELQNPAR
jgi:hypothetical protein